MTGMGDYPPGVGPLDLPDNQGEEETEQDCAEEREQIFSTFEEAFREKCADLDIDELVNLIGDLSGLIWEKTTTPSPEAIAIDEESWLALQGASRQDIGDAALHRQPGSTQKSRDRLSKLQNQKDHKLILRRSKLRDEYRQLVKDGVLRPLTEQERTIRTAQGHNDNQSTQAARRICAKRGWNWDER